MDEIYSYEDALKKFLHKKISETAYYFYNTYGWKDTSYNWYYAEFCILSSNNNGEYDAEFTRYYTTYRKNYENQIIIKELAYKLWEEDKLNSDIHNWLEAEKIINNKYTQQSINLYELWKEDNLPLELTEKNNKEEVKELEEIKKTKKTVKFDELCNLEDYDTDATMDEFVMNHLVRYVPFYKNEWDKIKDKDVNIFWCKNEECLESLEHFTRFEDYLIHDYEKHRTSLDY